MRNRGNPWPNACAQDARRLYADMSCLMGGQTARPAYNTYVGVSDRLPTPELLGPLHDQLQIVQLDELYVFAIRDRWE